MNAGLRDTMTHQWLLLAAAAAAAAPSLLAYNVSPSPTFLNQALALALWGAFVALLALATDSERPARRALHDTALPLLALALVMASVLWSWWPGALPMGLALTNTGLADLAAAPAVAAVPLDEPAIEPPGDSAGHALPGGKVVLRVFLAADGALDRVEVASSSLPPAYDQAAVAAFSRVRFRPGEIQGVAVSSESRFEVGFDDGDPGSSHASDRHGLSPATRAAAQK